MKRLILIPILLAGCATVRAVRLCGVGALDHRTECVVAFHGNAHGKITGVGARLVPRGLYPSTPPLRSDRELAIDEICGRWALRAQQEAFAHGEQVPYAPLEQACKRRERRGNAK